jgi:SAM-dependent methyltransferase
MAHDPLPQTGPLRLDHLQGGGTVIAIPQDVLDQIAAVPHFRRSPYANLDVPLTLEYARKRFIVPIQHHLAIKDRTLLDCGAGYGWLSFAYLLNGGSRAVLCDLDGERLAAARDIAGLLGLEQRCQFVSCPMQELQLAPRSVDVFASIETLEHVGRENIDDCLQIMASASRELILLTTPNKLFPVIMHDTRVPFAHWLPPEARRRYVRIFGRVDRAGNAFVAPWRLATIRRHFRPVSVVLTFPSVQAWEASYPFQSPYGLGDRWRERPPVWLKAWYSLVAALLHEHAYLLSPNLCSIWRRKEKPSQET